jgi:hypothetical protein
VKDAEAGDDVDVVVVALVALVEDVYLHEANEERVVVVEVAVVIGNFAVDVDDAAFEK